MTERKISMSEKLPKTIIKKTKRRGRGYGSGRGGHTAGRGTKGQKSRGKIGVLFEGIKMKKSFIKRLPLRRGKGKFKAKPKPLIVKLAYLDLMPAGTKVDTTALSKFGIVRKKDADIYGVKILGNGEIKKKFTVLLPISRSAAKRIEKAGGKIEVEKSEPPSGRTSGPKNLSVRGRPTRAGDKSQKAKKSKKAISTKKKVNKVNK